MILSEVAPVPTGSLPTVLLRDHLRLGSGFADDAVQDGLLAGQLRAALAAIEGLTGKAILARQMRLVVHDWDGAAGLCLPVAPVGSVQAVTLRDRTGAGSVLDPGSYWLRQDAHVPAILPVAAYLPALPPGGSAEILFLAGWPDWAAVPPDLAQAVLLLAAHYHEQRHAAGEAGAPVPFGIGALVARWRRLRLTAGGGGQ
ncbi:MAG: hypothetical protein N2422_02390 [Rhodobacteraceae bacterium]|nr:hypothetical protein [Paracoccaceae bacterium]